MSARRGLGWGLALAGLAAAACRPQASPGPAPAPAPGDGEAHLAAMPSAAPTAAVPSAPAAPHPLVIFLGDSLTAGLSLDEEEAFPALLGRRLASAGTPVTVVNAGVSGDTSAGGLARIDWLLAQKPDVLVVELGANDGLRGIAPEVTRTSLEQIVRRALAAHARVLLLGMRMPPSYGPDYQRRFAAVFPVVAQATGVALVPFFLDGVAGDPAFNLDDGIHPNARGHERIAELLLAPLGSVLTDPKATRATPPAGG